MDAPVIERVRLTQFSKGGGCGCKIAPAQLREILARSPVGALPPELMVGIASSDDAAVWKLNDEQALIATTDFFMPIVDDAFDFGRIAAANALSDVYAMGGRPILALAVVGMPVGKLPVETIQDILAGGAAICQQAGIPIAGGHSIDSSEPIYGLVALGLAHPSRVKRNDRARAGDVLVLGKPLGVGILSAALKKGVLGEDGYRAMLATTTRLNTPGVRLAESTGVHAMTDVTGFGLLGHLLGICRGSRLTAQIDFSRLPILADVTTHVQQGRWTGASERNWKSYGHEVRLSSGTPEWRQKLLTDPQTSGGLLVACAPEAVADVLEIFRDEGFDQAGTVGDLIPGEPLVRVNASA